MGRKPQKFTIPYQQWQKLTVYKVRARPRPLLQSVDRVFGHPCRAEKVRNLAPGLDQKRQKLTIQYQQRKKLTVWKVRARPWTLWERCIVFLVIPAEWQKFRIEYQHCSSNGKS